MYTRLNLPDFAKQKIYYYQRIGKRFLVRDGEKIEENWPDASAFSIEDDTGEVRLLTITKKPSILAPKGELTVSGSKNVASDPQVFTYGRRYTPNELFALIISVMMWAPAGALGLLLGLFVAFKIRPILLSDLSFLQKSLRIISYHVGAFLLYLVIGVLIVFVFKLVPLPN